MTNFVSNHNYNYPGPRGFSWYFTAWESCEKAAKRRTRVVKRRERKTSGYFGLESHFHADARVRIWPRARIGWYFYKHANKYDWSVWLVIPRGRWRYLLLRLPEKKFACKVSTTVLSLYKRPRFVCVLHWFCLGQCLQRNLTSVLKERFLEIESLNEHQSLARSHKSVAKMCSPAVFAILSIGHRK